MTNELSKKNYFVFTALSREYDKTIDTQKTRIFFVISLAILGVFAGLRGMIFSAFSQAGYRWDPESGREIWKHPVYNPIVAVESGTLEIAWMNTTDATTKMMTY